MGEVAGGELVGEQEIGGRIVGRADEGFGQSHDRQTFARRELEFVQKILDAAQAREAAHEVAARLAHRTQQDLAPETATPRARRRCGG